MLLPLYNGQMKISFLLLLFIRIAPMLSWAPLRPLLEASEGSWVLCSFLPPSFLFWSRCSGVSEASHPETQVLAKVTNSELIPT